MTRNYQKTYQPLMRLPNCERALRLRSKLKSGSPLDPNTTSMSAGLTWSSPAAAARSALTLILECGNVGETYNIGGRNERSNIFVVERICDLLDDIVPATAGSRRQLISFVRDRPGHDRRYAIDASKLERTLGWRAKETFDSGIDKTVRWYIDNETWWRAILDRGYTAKRAGLKV